LSGKPKLLEQTKDAPGVTWPDWVTMNIVNTGDRLPRWHPISVHAVGPSLQTSCQKESRLMKKAIQNEMVVMGSLTSLKHKSSD